MGQSGVLDTRAKPREKTRIPSAAPVELAAFPTELGWFGLWGANGKVVALSIGHGSIGEVQRAGQRLLGDGVSSAAVAERNWNPGLRRRLEQFASGRAIDFSDVELELPELTPFQSRIVAATRKVAYGRTVTYGELAKRAGFPRAARAVGSVMAANRFPIIVPCHRVVAAGGKVGGFSAPRGVSLKQHMLDLEAQSPQLS